MSSQKYEMRIALQARDFALLHGLLDSRLMTIKQAAILHFEGKREAAKKRLQKLHRAGFIIQRSRRPQEPAIYSLGRQGYLSLRQEGMIGPLDDPGWVKVQKRQQIGDLMLRHELAVVNSKASFIAAIAKHPHLELIEMSISPDRHGFRVIQAVPGSGGMIRFRSLIAKPDGFIRIRERTEDSFGAEHFFFLEVDMGTEALGRLRQKAQQYGQYYRKGGFAAKLGGAREDYKRFPFRVLMVFKTAQRRNNVAQMLLKADKPIKSQVWLTTMPELLEDPFGAIWIRPIDSQTMPKGLEHGMDGSKSVAGYIRRPHREITVEERGGKMKLFETEP